MAPRLVPAVFPENGEKRTMDAKAVLWANFLRGARVRSSDANDVPPVIMGEVPLSTNRCASHVLVGSGVTTSQPQTSPHAFRVQQGGLAHLMRPQIFTRARPVLLGGITRLPEVRMRARATFAPQGADRIILRVP